MRITIAFLGFFPASVWAQVYAVNVTAGGSGYSGTVTASASGGSCTTEPTFGAVSIAAGAVVTGYQSIPVTYAGVCTPGGTAPTVTITGNGSGAMATAVMLQASIAILGTPTVVSDQNNQDSISGTNKLYRYECLLVVPSLFVPLYSSSLATAGAILDRMPNTSQSSQISWAAISGASALQPLYASAFSAGILTVYDGTVSVSTGTAISVPEAVIVSNCGAWQTDLNAWNPWSNYGTYYNGTSWTAIGIQ